MDELFDPLHCEHMLFFYFLMMMESNPSHWFHSTRLVSLLLEFPSLYLWGFFWQKLSCSNLLGFHFSFGLSHFRKIDGWTFISKRWVTEINNKMKPISSGVVLHGFIYEVTCKCKGILLNTHRCIVVCWYMRQRMWKDT